MNFARRGISKRTIVASISAVMLLAACSTSDTSANQPVASPQGGAVGSGADTTPAGPPFYEGKDLEILVPYGAGGGVTVAAQLVAPFMNQYTEGNPSIRIENLGGGGTILGANEYALNRDPDGESVFFTASSNVMTWLIGNPEIRFDLSTMDPVISFPTGALVVGRVDAGLSSAEDLRTVSSPVTLAAKSPEGSELFALMAFEILGVLDNVNPIFGYDGGGDRRLAFEQGEVAMDHGTTPSFLGGGGAELVESGVSTILFTHGLVEGGQVVRDPALPDIRTVKEVYEEWYGEEPSGQLWDAYLLFRELAGGFGFAILLNGDAPAEALAALRAGAVDVAADPAFREQAIEVMGYQPTVGPAVVELGASLRRSTQDPTIVAALEWTRTWIIERFS